MPAEFSTSAMRAPTAHMFSAVWALARMSRGGQVMIIAGCDNGSTISLPNWRLNLRFAAAWEEAMESRFPGLTRPVLCGYRFYNQDLTTGSLLIEIGGHGNTLEEALRAGEFAALALAELLGGQQP